MNIKPLDKNEEQTYIKQDSEKKGIQDFTFELECFQKHNNGAVGALPSYMITMSRSQV